MKINEPVTQKEIPFPEGTILVTKTDLKGAITYCNRNFVNISGFSEQELMGSNHNIVRHPDMPPEAFKDLWDTVKSGVPWTGIVKNRCKNGDHYWVKANVTPLMRNGQVLEYMSVRSKPSMKQIQEAENLYRDINAGKAKLTDTSMAARLNIFKNLKVANKFLSISFAMLVPIVVLAYLLYDSFATQIEFSAKERDGVAYIEPLRLLLENFAKHRGLNNALKNGADVQAKVDTVRKTIDAAITDVEKVHERLGSDLKVDEAWPALKEKWLVLQNQTAGLAGWESFARHTALIEELHELIVRVGDYSNLILDPDLDTYYLMDVTVLRLPIVLENMGILRGKGSGFIGKGSMEQKQWLDATIRANRILDFTKATINSVETSFANNDTLPPKMQVALNNFKEASARFQVTVQKLLDNYQDLSSLDAAAFFAEGTESISTGYALYDLSLQNLDHLLENRVNAIQTSLNTKIILIIIVLGIVAWMTWLNVASIVAPLQRLLNSVRSITEGDYDISGIKNNRDEIGQAINATNMMSIQLGFDIADAKEKATAAIRIKLALDNNSTPTTVSDDSNTLIYMNAVAEQQFRDMEPVWQQAFPQFRVDELIGHNLSEYFDDSQLKDAYTAQLKAQNEIDGVIADRNMHLVASPIYDEDGHYAGRVTQWIDQTEMLAEKERERQRLEEERQVAAENQRIKVALDNVSSNVMLADVQRNIIYMNNNARQLFIEAESDIRQDLPNFNAAKLIGANIDGFHKDPSHQIKLLDSLKSTYVSQLEIGGRTMRITASPVIDASGERLGTAVEWADRTVEVSIEKEIDSLVEAANRGDLTQRLPTDGKQGFFLQLSNGFNGLLDQLTSVFNDIADVMGKMANGDLRDKIHSEYSGTFDEVKNNINQTIENVEQTVSRLLSISDSVQTAAEEILDGNNNLSSRTEQQASNLEETAASMEELTSTVKNNSDNAQQANAIASSARSSAEQGGRVVSDAIEAMKQINQASTKIAEIIGVIDEIAFQTNLLALNASVEAARAGEQGRGFAVVATEVRNLASRSAEAAKEIKELIKDSVAKVQSGSELVDQTGHSLEEIVTGVKKVGDIIAEIAAASAEQTAGIEQVNQAVTSLDEMTQQNAALAEETSAASASMSQNAREMQEVMGFFQTS